MSALRILQVGPASSIQDRGRFGGQRYGLGSAGAMDQLALAAANALVGNDPFTAAVEIGPFGCRLRAEGGPVRIALSGAERQASIDGKALAMHESALVSEGAVLELKQARGGVFSYLSIEGGLVGKAVFGSFSVHARAGLGVPYPRALASGDVLETATARHDSQEKRLLLPPEDALPIRVVLGPQDDYFTPEAISTLIAAEWTVSPSSDRMGYRLEGPALTHAKGHNIVSDGIAHGAIQVPGSGQPLVLLADRGTTGGYPKIAVVISADLHRFAQIPVGGKLRFAAVRVEEAQSLARDFAKMLAGLPARLETVTAAGLDTHALLSANLAGAAVDAADPHH